MNVVKEVSRVVSERVVLPPPRTEGGPGLWAALSARRSVRAYRAEPMTLEELSQLLWATQGATHRTPTRVLRTAPSAGACYPIETYVAAGEVTGLAPGLWRYEAGGHALDLVRPGDIRADLALAARQTFVGRAPVVFGFSLILERTARRYGERAFRYACLDCGHAAQNLALAACGLGYGTCMIGAFDDHVIGEIMGLDQDQGREIALYFVPVGRPARPGPAL